MKQSACLIVGLCLILTGVCEAGEETVVNGVLKVNNTAQPSDGLVVLELEEMWRHGHDDDELFFGLVVGVRTDESGNIFVLDKARGQVFVINPEGQLIKTLGRPGEGPGEVNNPSDFLLLPDGRVAFVKAMPGRLVTLHGDGAPAGDIHLNEGGPGQKGMVTLASTFMGGGNLVLGCVDQDYDSSTGSSTRETVLASYNLSGERLVTYHKRDVNYGFEPFSFSEKKNLKYDIGNVDVGHDGRVYCATEYDKYRITVFQASGTIDRIIERENEPVKRSPAEYNAIYDLFDAAIKEDIPPPYDLEVARNEPAICNLQKGLQVAHDGRLWVLPSSGLRHQPEGILQTFDVFSADGHFENQISIPGTGNASSDIFLLAGPDQLVRVMGYMDAVKGRVGSGKGNDDDDLVEPLQVVLYRIK